MQGLVFVGGTVFLVMLFSLAIALAISRTLVRSLERLRQHALCVGRGECRVTDEVAGTVEFQELKQAFDKMATQLKQRADEVEVSNDLLRKETAELARSNKDLEDFAYVSSHDLQEPLRMVTGYLELLQRRYKDRLDADADEFIAYAVDGANRMQRLIIDLLAYSRVGSKGLALTRVSLQGPLDNALLNLKTALESSGAQVTHDEMPVARVDLSRIEQVFQNLIGNAIKFCKAGSPKIHVGTAKEKGGWRISVSDNGIGIEEQYLERIFGIFQRLHTHKEYPGSGIGLAICKRTIERHGGRIWAESEPGKGSTFYFTITA
jgi:light-regulated signal transduction histidine kinase (bacteriophytochrome)